MVVIISLVIFSCVPLGQHDCVTVINNFFPRERLDYYTKPQGLDKEPKLPVKLAGPLHKIITTTNMHPVKVKLYVNCMFIGVGAVSLCQKAFGSSASSAEIKSIIC